MKKEKKDQVLCVLAKKIRDILLYEGIEFYKLQEIRIREENPLAIRYEGKEKMFSHYVTREQLRETMEYIGNYSLYAYEHELSQGYLTIEGGHRVGISGKVIVEDNKVRNFQYISSVNIRISHEIKGCADKILPSILKGGQVCHTMIISPPGGGKTTLLRDMVRQISDGNPYLEGKNVAVVDERSEIGGCFRGVAQNQLGKRTDVLDNCPKAEGMMMMIRSMSPQVLAVDEIGTEADMEAVAYAMHSGTTILATIHGASLEEIKEKPMFRGFWEGQYFKRYIVMKGLGQVGEIKGIYNERGMPICTH